MLPKGSISKVYEYYFTNPKFNGEIMRAMQEFFDWPDLGPGGHLETNERSEGLFNEWFLYDFILTNGNTILADFVSNNPLKLPQNEMLLYQNISRTNVYSLYEVIRVDIDKGLNLKNLQTGKETYVYEKKLTTQLKPGSLFFTRIGMVNDHYELIGADTFSIDSLDEPTKKSFRNNGLRYTSKVAHDILKNYKPNFYGN